MSWAAVLLATGVWLPCTPMPPDEPSPVAGCARRAEDGSVQIEPAVAAHLSFDHGLAAVWVEGGFRYVDRRGRTAPVLAWDNGPDPFVEDRARTVREGRVGFLDRHLREVVAARWDFAEPFTDGLAAVCLGCRLVPDGEHARVEGGRWGYVDRDGRTVLEPAHTREDLPPPREARRRPPAR